MLLDKKNTLFSVASIPVALAAIFLAALFLLMPAAPSQAESAGWALQFDGTTDQVVFTYTKSILGIGWETAKTVSLWVKPTSSTICPYNDVAWCDAIFGDRPRWWGISIGDTSGGTDPAKDRIWIWNTDNSTTSRFDVLGVEYTLGEWVNITLVHGDGILRAYRNGIEMGSVASGATAQPALGALPWLQIGGIIGGTDKNWTFEGQLDEVHFWNRALTATEINQYIYQSLSGDEPGLRAYYRMSDGPGSAILTDDSLFDWTGVLVDGGTGVSGNGTLPLWVPSDLELSPPPTMTVTPTGLPPHTPTPTGTETPTPTASHTPTPTDTETPTPTASYTPTPTDTETATPTASSTPTPTDTETSAPTASYTPTLTGTMSPSSTASVTPTPIPTTSGSPGEDPPRVFLPLLMISQSVIN